MSVRNEKKYQHSILLLTYNQQLSHYCLEPTDQNLIMRFLSRIIWFLADLGIEETNSQKEKSRIRVINILVLSLIPFWIGFFIYFKIGGYQKMIPYLLIAASFSTFPIILNAFKLQSLSRYVFLLQNAPLIYMYTLIFGNEIGIGYFMVITLALPIVFLKHDEKRSIISFFIYNVLFLYLIEFGQFLESPLLSFRPEETNTVKFFVLSYCVVYALTLFIQFYRAVNKTEFKLIEQKERAEQAEKTKKEFLATMSHEIRTPLNAVITISELLNERQRKDEYELLQALSSSSKHLLSIVNNILDLSKFERFNHIDDNYIDMDIRQLISDLEGVYQHVASQKNLDFEVNVSDQLTTLYEFPKERLVQIISNLLSNAIKFTESGKVVLNVILKESSKNYDKITFEVVDTGIGIPEDQRQRVFSAFHQISSDTNRKYEGTGLGLAIVHSILNQFGSEIQVTSTLGSGSGTKFYFDLILRRSDLSSKAPQRDQNSLQLNGVEALIVDDNRMNTLVLKKLLDNYGLTSQVAYNAYEAIEKTLKKDFDVVFMDIHMPEMDGIEATKQIFENKSHYLGKVYALSADVLIEDNPDAQHLFGSILRKPIDKTEIVHILRHVQSRTAG